MFSSGGLKIENVNSRREIRIIVGVDCAALPTTDPIRSPPPPSLLMDDYYICAANVMRSKRPVFSDCYAAQFYKCLLCISCFRERGNVGKHQSDEWQIIFDTTLFVEKEKCSVTTVKASLQQL